MIRLIEIRRLGDEELLVEHVKPTRRHIKTLCGLRPGKAEYTLEGFSVYVHEIAQIHACMICRTTAVDHKFFVDDVED